MEKLTVIKTANEIEDVCITYGLAYILEMNDINFNIKNMNSKYIVESDFEIDNIDWEDITLEECNLINSTLSRANINSQLKNMNKYFSKSLSRVLSYFVTLDDEYIKEDKNVSCIQAGTGYYTLGVRATNQAKSFNVKEHKRHLAFLGFVKSTSYIKNSNIEINSILIPRQTDEILRPYVFGKVNEETGEFQAWTSMGSLTDTELIARVYLETHKQYAYLKRDYEKVVYMTFIPAGNKPLFGKTFDLFIKDWSSDLCYNLNFELYSRNATYDTKDALAKYINNDKYNNFNKVIKIYAKENKILDFKYKEELIGMYENKIQKIYHNEAVGKIARAFGRLSYDKTGYEVQAKLNSVANMLHLQDVIVSLGDIYLRKYNYTILTSNEFKEVIDLVETRKDAKVVANAILAGKVFVDFDSIKKNKEEK